MLYFVRYFSLWKLLQAEHSQIAIQCVPLLLHCLTLPTGADLLWKLVEDDFNNDDWRARFSAGKFYTQLTCTTFYSLTLSIQGKMKNKSNKRVFFLS